MKETMMALKKIIATLTSMVLAGCSTILPATINPQKINNIDFKPFSIKSTTDLNVIKKNFVSNKFIRKTGKPSTETVTFNVSPENLKRNFILNIINGPQGYSKVSSALIKINGKIHTSQKDFNQNVNEIGLGAL